MEQGGVLHSNGHFHSAGTKDNQCGTAEEGNGWEFVCQRQVSVGGDEGHPAFTHLYTDLP